MNKINYISFNTSTVTPYNITLSERKLSHENIIELTKIFTKYFFTKFIF